MCVFCCSLSPAALCRDGRWHQNSHLFFLHLSVFSRHQAAKAQSYKQCKWKTMTMCADLAQASSFFFLRPPVVVSCIWHLSSRMTAAHLIRAVLDLEEIEEAYGPRECWSRWLMTWPQEATVPASEDTLQHTDKRSRWVGITGQNEQNNHFPSASGSLLFSRVISCYLVIRVRSWKMYTWMHRRDTLYLYVLYCL